MHMAQRGRPRQDRPRHDYGTPELISKRITLSPMDATQGTSPLDVAHAKGLISDEAYTAAVYFAGQRKLVFGKAIPPASDLTAVSRGGLPDELDVGTAQRNYMDACTAMKCQGRQAFDAIENVVVHERWPDWLSTNRGQHTTNQKHFGLGCAALLGWYRGRSRKAAS